MILSSIIWDVNPEILPIGSLAIRWYGLLFALGFVFGYIIIGKMFKNENLPEKMLDSLTTYMVVGTVVGARLGHCLFYQPGYYLSNPIEILKIWEGGLASHGAAIGILLALYIFSKKVKKPYLWTLDRIVIIVALAGFFIRIGNLMNHEIYGDVTNLPWGFNFVLNINQWIAGAEPIYSQPSHPTQIYEALSYLAIFGILYAIYLKVGPERLKTGLIFSIFLILLFSVRFFIEFIKEPQVAFEENMALNMGQLLSIPFVLTGFVLLFRALKKNN